MLFRADRIPGWFQLSPLPLSLRDHLRGLAEAAQRQCSTPFTDTDAVFVLLLHIARCQMAYPARYAHGVPVPSTSLDDFKRIRQSGAKVLYSPLVEHGTLTVTGYSQDTKTCRRFSLADHVQDELVELGMAEVDARTAHPQNPRRPKTRPVKTSVGHYRKRDYALIHAVLRVLKPVRAMVNLAAFEDHLRHQHDLYAEARAYGQPDTQRLRQRLMNDLYTHTGLRRQYEHTLAGGHVSVRQAYDVQPRSGRLTDVGTRIQNTTREGKAALFAGIPDVYNYDIESSQTAALRLLIDRVNDEGAGLDAQALAQYPGKKAIAQRYGFALHHPKRAEHAAKFGAGFEATYDRALQRRTYNHVYSGAATRYGSTMVDIAEAIAASAPMKKSPHDVYEALRDVYGPIAKVVHDLARYLLGPYFDVHSTPCPGGRCLKGPCMRLTLAAHEKRTSYESRTRVMTLFLQGLEAAFIHHLTILAGDYDFEVMANEHDGLITRGMIPQEAIDKARERSGFTTANLIEKPFAADHMGMRLVKPAESEQRHAA